MNYFDIIILVPVMWGAYKGFSKGLIKTVASLAALILGIYGAIAFSEMFANILKEQFHYTSEFTPVFTFAATFIIIVIAVHLIAKILDKIIKAVALGPINRIAGSLFNIIKTAFIISVIMSVFNTFDENFNIIPSEQKNKSLLYKPILKLSPLLFKYLNFDLIHHENNKEEEQTEI